MLCGMPVVTLRRSPSRRVMKSTRVSVHAESHQSAVEVPWLARGAPGSWRDNCGRSNLERHRERRME